MPRSHSCHFRFLYEIQRRLRQSWEDQMHTFSKRSAVALIAAFLVTFAIAGLAQEQKFKAVPVKTTDALTISAQDWRKQIGDTAVTFCALSGAADPSSVRANPRPPCEWHPGRSACSAG